MRKLDPLTILALSLRDFFRDRGPIYAGSLAYFFIVAVVPLCLFIVTIIGYVLGEGTDFFNYFVERMLGLFPAITSGVTEELRKLITYRGIGKISILIYAAVAFQLYGAMHSSMQAIFKVEEKRHVLNTILLSFAVVTIFVSLMFVSFSLSTAVPLIKALDEYFPRLQIGSMTAIMLRYVLPLLLVLATAMFMYVILPKRRVRLAHAFWGGLFTSLMLEVAKHLFTWYVGTIRFMGAIYGSLTAFVVFLLWIYYSASIFLIGGELVHNIGEYPPHPPRRRATDRMEQPSEEAKEEESSTPIEKPHPVKTENSQHD